MQYRSDVWFRDGDWDDDMMHMKMKGVNEYEGC